MTNIDTPNGWERREKFLFRQYEHKFATIWIDENADFQSTVATVGECVLAETCEATLPEAVAWANDHLGVPKPVEVVVEKFADGSYVLKDKENTRWATVCKFGVRWYVGTIVEQNGYAEESEALEASRAYVRGAS